ncbi:MAG: glycoside hydrolase family 18 protein, partial [Burkholderiales bacterium]|nr:glycoside hydrolase family 18 protein [Burkholderiales bacterium]
ESGLPALTITKAQTTTLAIPLKASTIAKNNVTVAISGLSSADKAGVTFTDAANKYSYVNYAGLANSSPVYKIESGLNLGTSVAASGSSYVTNPITSTGVVNAAKTISATFVAKPAPSGASYDYQAPFKDYNNKIVLSVQGITSAKSLAFTSNFQQKSGWGNCFGQQVDNLNFSTVSSGSKFVTTITLKESSKSLDLTQSCDIMGTDSASAIVLPGVVDPIVYNVTVDGQSLTINQPCSATGCKDPGNGYVNAGYYAQWAVWGRQYNPYNMPFKNINDVIYAFVGFNPASGDIKTLDASADSWGMSALSRAMLQYPYMKAHLSFGGWTNNGVNTAPMFETLASSQASMDNFATQAISLMRKTGFTGIDIDWEWWSDYPNNLAPAKKMLTFYQTLRTALDKASREDSKTYTLTIAVNGGSDRVLALQSSSNINAVANFWAQVGALMDHINVMNYDYHGSFDVGQAAYFQANYDFQNVGSNKVGKDEGWSIKSSMDTYIANGVPAKKLVAGIPLYARTMTVASATNGGLFQTVTGAGFGDYENGILDYKCIVNPINNPATGCGSDKPIAGVKSLAYYNSTTNTAVFNLYGLAAMQPWAYSATTNTFMTYDDQFSATQKAKAVKASGLGGTMFWELDGDSTDSNTSIVQAVKNELSK